MRHARSDYDPIQDPRGLIPEDEPVFLIRGQDVTAPTILEAWAHGLEQLVGETTPITLAVRAHAERMRVWQQDHGSKLPDAPEGTL